MLARSSVLLLTAAVISLGACSSDTPSGPESTSLAITAVPKIVLNPTSIRVFAHRYYASPHFTLSITNGGGGTLHWVATTKTSWITLTHTSGVAPSNVVVYISTKAPLGGIIRGSITVSAAEASNSPQTVIVTRYLR